MADVEMTIEGVHESAVAHQRFVILKEKSPQNKQRYLQIWVGPSEADAIAMKLQNVTVPVRLAHDLLCEAFRILDAKVSRAAIHGLDRDVYYAKLVIGTGRGQAEIDCRPCDALAVALRCRAPIFVNEDVLKKAGMVFDYTGKPVPCEKTEAKTSVFSKSARDIFSRTEDEARRLNHSSIGTGHLLIALLRGSSRATAILMNMGVDPAQSRAAIEASVADQPTAEGSEPGLTAAVKETVQLAIEEAKLLGSRQVEPEHILIGLVRQQNGIAAGILGNLKISPERLYAGLIRELITRP
jgi:bifunctional DNase/RNase